MKREGYPKEPLRDLVTDCSSELKNLEILKPYFYNKGI